MSTLENAVSRITSVSGSASLIFFSTVRPSPVGQPVVEQHEIDPFAMLLERLGGRLRLDHAIAFLREPIVQRPANQLLVVDDENRGFGHVLFSVDESQIGIRRA